MRVEPPASAPSLASAAAAAVAVGAAAVAVAASSRLAILQLTNLQKVGNNNNNNNVDVAGNAIDGNWLTFVLFKFVFFGLPRSLSLSLSLCCCCPPRVCVLCVCELTLRRILSHSSQLGYTPQKEMRIITSELSLRYYRSDYR